jgi:hypothetical protein
MKTKVQRIARNKVNNYIINTVKIENRYETAIKQDDRNWVVVQEYEDITRAEVGHKHWCSKCVDNPLYAYDVKEKKNILF